MQDEVKVTQAEDLQKAWDSVATLPAIIFTDDEAQTLAEAFARHQAERDTLARMEPVAFTALVGTRRERRRIESVNELLRLINGGSFISEIRPAVALPPAPEAGQ